MGQFQQSRPLEPLQQHEEGCNRPAPSRTFDSTTVGCFKQAHCCLLEVDKKTATAVELCAATGRALALAPEPCLAS